MFGYIAIFSKGGRSVFLYCVVFGKELFHQGQALSVIHVCGLACGVWARVLVGVVFSKIHGEEEVL